MRDILGDLEERVGEAEVETVQSTARGAAE